MQRQVRLNTPSSCAVFTSRTSTPPPHYEDASIMSATDETASTPGSQHQPDRLQQNGCVTTQDASHGQNYNSTTTCSNSRLA